MSAPSKERMSLSAPGDDEATQMTTQDARWLNGVNRQLQPEGPARSVTGAEPMTTDAVFTAQETHRRPTADQY